MVDEDGRMIGGLDALITLAAGSSPSPNSIICSLRARYLRGNRGTAASSLACDGVDRPTGRDALSLCWFLSASSCDNVKRDWSASSGKPSVFAMMICWDMGNEVVDFGRESGVAGVAAF